MNLQEKAVLALISFMVVAAIAATAWSFLEKEEYAVTIEAACVPSEQACFFRDCSTEECLPNGFGHYRVFTVSASDFPRCADDSCLQECATGSISCEETMCGESEEDVCSSSEEDDATAAE